MTVQSNNAIEEIQEIIEKCTACGMCKALCPVFSILKEETLSPRGKVLILKKDIYDKIIFDCSLCKACEVKCAQQLKLCEAFKKARLILAENNKATDANKEMIENIRKFGNPFGKQAEKGKFYCC